MRRELLFAGCLLVSTTANAAGKQLLWGDTHEAKPDVAYERHAVVHPYHKANIDIFWWCQIMRNYWVVCVAFTATEWTPATWVLSIPYWRIL